MVFGWGKSSKHSSLDDRLSPDAVTTDDGWLQGTGGMPPSADSCAYEPVQRLLAVGTWDGRIKLYGGPGVERTIYSNCYYAYGTKHLEFLPNRGILIRLSEGGFLESWSLTSSKGGRVGHVMEGTVTDLSSIKLDGDTITSCASMRRDPFVLLGCASGCLRFAVLVGQGGGAVQELRQPTSMRLLPYRVPVEELRGGGEVEAVAVRSLGPLHLVLTVHANTGVSLWDMRKQQLRAQLNPRAKDVAQPALRKAGKVSAVAWLLPGLGGGGQGGANDFATGHDTGDILVWSLPALDSEGTRPGVMSRLRVVPGGAEPVRSLKAIGGRRQALLVLGGQPEEQPDGMALLALPGEGDSGVDHSDEEDDGGGAATVAGGASCCKLPWLGRPVGASVLPSPGAMSGFEDASCVLQLLDSCQLALFDVSNARAKKPTLIHPPGLQQGESDRGDVTCTAACVVHLARSGGMPAYAITLAGVKAAGAQNGRMVGRVDAGPGAGVGAGSGGWKAPLGQWVAGGTAPKPEGTHAPVLATGHKTGCVMLWDLSGEQPRLLLCAPSAPAGNTKMEGGGSLRGVSALDVVPEHGIVCTGHSKGEVRIYQFAEKGRAVEVVTLSGAGQKAGRPTKVQEEAGLQLRVRCVAHEAEVVQLSYSPAAKAVAVLDKTGLVSVLDMRGPALMWCAAPMAQPVACLAVANIPAPPKKDRAPGCGMDEVAEGAPCSAVLLVGADACVTAVTLEAGVVIGKNGELKPKNRSLALCCEPLDAEYRPLWLAGGKKGGQKKKGGAGWRSTLQGGGKGRIKRDDSDTEEEEDDQGSDDDVALPEAPEVMAAHLLVVSDQYMRIYSVSSVVSGGRATESKVSPRHPLLWAAPFHVEGGPGLVGLALPADGGDPVFLIYSLPSLSLICEQPVSYATAPPVGHVGHSSVVWQPPSGPGKARRTIAATRQGAVMLLAQGNEVLQLHVTNALAPPATPAGVYDWEVAMAAHAAATAHEQSLLEAIRRAGGAAGARSGGGAGRAGGRGGGRGGGSEEDELVDAELEEGGGKHQGGFGLPLDLGKQLIGGVFKGMSKVVEGTSKGLATVAKGVETGVKGVATGVARLLVEDQPSPLDTYNMQFPELLVVLAQPMAEERPKGKAGSRRAKADEEDDGIPISQPQALVLPVTSAARDAARHAAGATSGRAGAGAGTGAAAAGTTSGRTSRRSQEADGNGSDSDDPAPSKANGRRGGMATAAGDAAGGSGGRQGSGGAGGGSARGYGGGAGGGSARGAAGASGRQSSGDAGAEAGPSGRGGNTKIDYADTDDEEEEQEAQGPGAASRGYAAANKLAQDMRTQLMGGAKAVVGAAQAAGATLSRLANDEDDERGAGSSARRYAPEETRQGTAADVKAKYSRGREGAGGSDRAATTNARVKGIAEVANETRSKLQERGEKLSRMDENAADMQNEAAGFAELAKQLADQQRNRKWWQ